jgi:hypothetical protein
MSFSFLLPQRPVSGQKRSNPLYKEAVRQAARLRGRAVPGPEPLYARIVWLHRERRDQDVDNIVKPILDALNGIAYNDDSQIAQCQVAAFLTSPELEVPQVNVDAKIHKELMSILDRSPEHVLYIEIGPAATKKVAFGPLDGGAP